MGEAAVGSEIEEGVKKRDLMRLRQEALQARSNRLGDGRRQLGRQPIGEGDAIPDAGVLGAPGRFERDRHGQVVDPSHRPDQVAGREPVGHGETRLVGRDDGAPAGAHHDHVSARRRRLEDPDAELARQRLDRILAGARPAAAELDPLPVKVVAPNPPADAVVRLEDEHIAPGVHERARRREAGQAGTDDDDVRLVERHAGGPHQIGGRWARHSRAASSAAPMVSTVTSS